VRGVHGISLSKIGIECRGFALLEALAGVWPIPSFSSVHSLLSVGIVQFNETLKAATMSKHAATISDAMTAQLYNAETGLFNDGMLGGADNHSAWHAQMNPLWFGLVPDAQQSKMVAFLAAKGMVGSVYGALPSLSANNP
jgi:hypothetical protein